jgi:hypothetical protein
MISILSHVVLAGFLAQEQTAPDIPVVTVCEALEGWDRYNGKSIIVIGLVIPTVEGTWQSETCKRKTSIGGSEIDKCNSTIYVVSGVARAPSCLKDFRWDYTSLDAKLKELQRSARLDPAARDRFRRSGAEWMAIYGRFETSSQGPGRGSGYLGGSRAQLISGKDCFHEWKDQ